MKAVIRLAAIASLLTVATAPAAASVEKHKDWDKSPSTSSSPPTRRRPPGSPSPPTRTQRHSWPSSGEARPGPEDARQRVPTPVRKARGHGRRDLQDPEGARRPDRAREGLHPDRAAEEDRPAGRQRRERAARRKPAGSPISAPLGSYRTLVYTFQYEKEQLPPWAGLKSFEANFEVDEDGNGRASGTRGRSTRSRKRGRRPPSCTGAEGTPVYRTREQAEAEQKAAIAAAAAAAAGPALTPPVRTSLEGLYAKPPGGALTVLRLRSATERRA